jgi:hypothetical protein
MKVTNLEDLQDGGSPAGAIRFDPHELANWLRKSAASSVSARRGQRVASLRIVGRPPRLSKAIVGRREHKVTTQSVLS